MLESDHLPVPLQDDFLRRPGKPNIDGDFGRGPRPARHDAGRVPLHLQQRPPCGGDAIKSANGRLRALLDARIAWLGPHLRGAIAPVPFSTRS